MSDVVEYALVDSVAVLSCDDGKANAVGYALIEALNDGLDRASDEAESLVIAGREGMFSAGFDLQEIGKGAAAAGALVDRGARLLLRLFSHPQPVVAAATGHAIAAGAFMLLASDSRLAAEGSYKFGLNETAIGMALPVFGIQLARARLASQHLTQAVTQATLYDAAGAQAVGFVDRVLPAQALYQAAIEEAARLGELDRAAYAANKLAWRQPYIDAIRASLG